MAKPKPVSGILASLLRSTFAELREEIAEAETEAAEKQQPLTRASARSQNRK